MDCDKGRAYDKTVVVLNIHITSCWLGHGSTVSQWEFTSIGLGLIQNVSAFAPLIGNPQSDMPYEFQSCFGQKWAIFVKKNI